MKSELLKIQPKDSQQKLQSYHLIDSTKIQFNKAEIYLVAGSKAALGQLLLGELDSLSSWGLLDIFFVFLLKDDLNVAWLTLVGVDTTVGTVSAAASLLSTVGGDVADG